MSIYRNVISKLNQENLQYDSDLLIHNPNKVDMSFVNKIEFLAIVDLLVE